MIRQARPLAFACRRDVANLAPHEGQMACQAAIARQLQVPRGTVSRDLAANARNEPQRSRRSWRGLQPQPKLGHGKNTDETRIKNERIEQEQTKKIRG
jgi:hypothetical protein